MRYTGYKTILKERGGLVSRTEPDQLVVVYEPVGSRFEREQQRVGAIESILRDVHIFVLYWRLEQKFIGPPEDYLA